MTRALLRTLFDAEGVFHAFDDVEEVTRLNVMLVEPIAVRRIRVIYRGGTWRRPSRGSAPPAGAMAPGGVVVLAGSLPPGLPQSAYLKLVDWLRGRGVRDDRRYVGDGANARAAGPTGADQPIAEEADGSSVAISRTDADALDAAQQVTATGLAAGRDLAGERGAVGAGPGGPGRRLPRRSKWQYGRLGRIRWWPACPLHSTRTPGLPKDCAGAPPRALGTAMTPATHLCRREDFGASFPP